MRLVFASNNAHKLREVREIFGCGMAEDDKSVVNGDKSVVSGGRSVEVLSLNDIGFQGDIEETGKTLEENSAIKAHAVWNYVRKIRGIDGVFADDTGLEICALGGQPGVYTARWAGELANDANNRQKALRELAGVKDRSARFRTAITLIMNGKEIQVEGVVNGCIAETESGVGGFGYDPLFVPEGYDKTFACLTEEEKNAISHRGRAVRALLEKIK